MNSVLLALVIAAGAGLFAYSKLGRRVGYGNGQKVWGAVAITVLIVFVMVLIFLKTIDF